MCSAGWFGLVIKLSRQVKWGIYSPELVATLLYRFLLGSLD